MDYLKVLLYIYPRINKVVDDIDEVIMLKALNSYDVKGQAEKQIQAVIDLVVVKDKFLILRDNINSILDNLTREDLYLLEYKYFRRNRKLKNDYADMSLDYCERTYFRKQTKLIAKLYSKFCAKGMTCDWFFENFNNVKFVMNYYKKITESKEKTFCEKRKRNVLACTPNIDKFSAMKNLTPRRQISRSKPIKVIIDTRTIN